MPSGTFGQLAWMFMFLFSFSVWTPLFWINSLFDFVTFYSDQASMWRYGVEPFLLDQFEDNIIFLSSLSYITYTTYTIHIPKQRQHISWILNECHCCHRVIFRKQESSWLITRVALIGHLGFLYCSPGLCSLMKITSSHCSTAAHSWNIYAWNWSKLSPM